MDYLFAITMFSNPLFWMEMQFLSEKRKNELTRIMPIWKQYRESLAYADVTPIGEKPSGRSFTGFCAVSNDGNGQDVFLLLFRESTYQKEGIFQLPLTVECVDMLGENGKANWNIMGRSIIVTFSNEKNYVFLKAKRK